jgi:RAQPRD family integrative conjugative element protein
MDCLAMTFRRLSWAMPLLMLSTLVGVAGSAAHAANRDGVRDDIARQDLALLQDQLAQAQRIVHRLDARVVEFDPQTTRVFLDVPRLRRDLATVAEGIDEVLSPPRLPPRQPAPLAGDYLRELP